MKRLIFLSIFFIGCDSMSSTMDGITGDLAARGAAAIIASAKEKEVSDICENCNGTGKVGDSVVEKVCPVCKGSGKK